VHRRVVLLHAPVVAAAEHRAVGGEQRRPDRDPALRQTLSCLLDRDVQHLLRCHGVTGATARSLAIFDLHSSR
jgi:hypothetical protein